MGDQSHFWNEVWRAIVANSIIVAALWGAAGGLTNALVVADDENLRKQFWSALRKMLLGALIAGGGGVTMAAVVANQLGLDFDQLAAAGATGSFAYFVGVFGQGVIEVILLRFGKKGSSNDNQ